MSFPANIIKKKKKEEIEIKPVKVGKKASDHVLESMSPEFKPKKARNLPEEAIEIEIALQSAKKKKK